MFYQFFVRDDASLFEAIHYLLNVHVDHPCKIIPQEIIGTYDLRALVDDPGWIYMRIEKGMYGLKQAGTIANQE